MARKASPLQKKKADNKKTKAVNKSVKAKQPKVQLDTKRDSKSRRALNETTDVLTIEHLQQQLAQQEDELAILNMEF